MNYQVINKDAFFWLLEGLCAIHRKPFSLTLAMKQCAEPYTNLSLISTLDNLGFSCSNRKSKSAKLQNENFPLIAWYSVDTISELTANKSQYILPILILQAEGEHILCVTQDDVSPKTITLKEFSKRYTGHITRISPKIDEGNDEDSAALALQSRRFDFSWFIPELMRHKKLWQEILLASLVIQLIALTTPLFTQAIIDKVVVHRTQSTLIVIAIGMLVFMIFSAGLSWLRQYLVLHTGNRVDAVLGAAVFERLFKLPPLYFQHRSTGVISARMHGVETIREFIASAAVTIILDLPFLLIFVAIMFYYSATLTMIVLVILAAIVTLSAIVAPLFQKKLQQQFQLGARNQAFITEYIVGLETVKSLQLEPQLNSKFSGYLATYLQAGFDTKQLANSYNTISSLLEQIMTLLILAIGAYTVMHSTEFTIGMLVAFQMFSGRLSQPMLRLVGLWQQFQQARLSVARLGDLMNAPVEPYAIVPSRTVQRSGRIKIEQVSFKYSEDLPFVYENLNLDIASSQTIAIMGPSGCGKSTLAKLLQGFYQPNTGRIFIDGVDIRYLSANELRSHFGVVPQETTLFSGTIYDNLQMASPEANFEQITAACQMAEIHQTIEALPKGYQTEIGERGAGLSGGQKQRIAIARALLKRPSILVFDEATSALDTNTEEHFAQTINGLRGKVTMLFITHGLPKGLHVDAVYRLGHQGAQRVALAPSGGLNQPSAGSN